MRFCTPFLVSEFFCGLLVIAAIPAASQTAVHAKASPQSAIKTNKSAALGKGPSGSNNGSKAQPAPALPIETVITVTVRPNSDVSDRTFTLGEIADIQGEDKALTAQLAAVEVGASPLPGMSRIIYPGDVTVKLRQHHLEIKRIEVVLPPGIRISRSGHEVQTDEITKAALESGKDAIKNIPDATLEPLPGGSKMTVPQGKTQVVAGAWRGTPELGVIYVPVSVSVDGKLYQTIEVTLKIHRKTVALVARHEIRLHDVITPQDVALMPVDLPSSMTQPVMTIEEAIGKRATRRIMADAPIGNEMLEKAPLISANDTITIEYVFGTLRVTAPGLARQTGAAGDTIHVFAPDTKKDLDGVVIDRHTVRIADNDNR